MNRGDTTLGGKVSELTQFLNGQWFIKCERSLITIFIQVKPKKKHNIQFKNKTKSVLDVQVLQTKACILDFLFFKRTIHYIVKYKT